MIDETNGTIGTKYVKLFPGFLETQFHNSPEIEFWRKLASSTSEIAIFERKSIDFWSLQTTFWARFQRGILRAVLIGLDTKIISTSSSWLAPDIIRERSLFKQLLRKKLDAGRHVYKWGFILVGTNELTFRPAIKIHYYLPR